MSEAVQNKRIHRIEPTWLVLGGLLAAFFGERVMSGFDTGRVVMALLGGGALLVALVMRFGEANGAAEEHKPVQALLLRSTALVVLAMLIYLPLAFGDSAAKWRAIPIALWPIVLALGLFPLLSVELAVAPVSYIDRYEARRVQRAFQRGLGLALLCSVLVLVNFLAKRHDLKSDLSAGKKATASEGTQRIIRDLSKPVRVVLFFPNTNDVAEALEPYFDSLKGLSQKMELVRIDQALNAKLAGETGVNENGYVTVSLEKTHEKIRVGTSLKSSRASLRSFDSDFAKALVKVTRQKSVAYVTVGHGERSTEPSSDDKRPPLTLIKTELKANQYDVKPLGIAEGLGSEVPKDASVVLIIGPEKPFLEQEIETLRQYAQHGGRMLIALDPERMEGDNPLGALLGDLGVKFDKTPLVNDQAFVRVNYAESDKSFIYSNHYSSHASVSTMTRNSSKLATLFARAGSIDKIEPSPANTRVDIVLRALDTTYGDKNDNLVFDPGEEKKGWGLAAAVTRTASSSKDLETRVFLTSDADLFSDTYIRFQGNPYFWIDVVTWLRDLKDPVLPALTEDDVRIVHKREEDALWFYSTIFGAPAVVAAAGFLGTRKRRRK